MKDIKNPLIIVFAIIGVCAVHIWRLAHVSAARRRRTIEGCFHQRLRQRGS